MSEIAEMSRNGDGNVRNKRSTIIENGSVTEERVNDAIIRFIIDDLQPFNRSESKSFRNLLAGNLLLKSFLMC